jgi:hypothetical protein
MLTHAAKQLRFTQRISDQSTSNASTRELMLIAATSLCTNRTAVLELSRVAKIDLHESNLVLMSLRQAAGLLLDKYGMKKLVQSADPTENPDSHQTTHCSSDLTVDHEHSTLVTEGDKNNAITPSDSGVVPSKKRQPSQEEFWRELRASGVTQSQINATAKSMPRLVPVNSEVMAHISRDGKNKLLCFLNELGHQRLVSIDECVAKLTNFGFNCVELEDDIGVEIEGVIVPIRTHVNNEWALSAFDILRPLMSLSDVKWESEMTGQGFLLRDLLNRLGERWQIEVDFL